MDIAFPGESAEYRAARDLPLTQGPCPSCTAFLDQLDGAAEHAAQHVNLAVAGKAPIERILTFAAERGWRRLHLLSSAGTTYNRDYLAETPDGEQQPMLNVFHRDGGTIRHFWGSELFYAPEDPGQDPRHVGTLEPVWNLYDLTPEGRGTDWTRAGCPWRDLPAALVFLGPSSWIGSGGAGDPVPFKTVGGDRFTAAFTIPASYVGGETGASPNPALPVRSGDHYAFATYDAGICDVPFTVTNGPAQVNAGPHKPPRPP